MEGGGLSIFDPPSRNNQQSPGALNMCVCLLKTGLCVCCGVFWLHARTGSHQEIDQRLCALSLSLSIYPSHSYFSHSLFVLSWKHSILLPFDFFSTFSHFLYPRVKKRMKNFYCAKRKDVNKVKWKKKWRDRGKTSGWTHVYIKHK